MKLGEERLRSLPHGTSLWWVHESGRLHKAKLLGRRTPESVRLRVFFDEVAAARSWSLRTNKPLSEFGKNYAGRVWLELADAGEGL